MNNKTTPIDWLIGEIKSMDHNSIELYAEKIKVANAIFKASIERAWENGREEGADCFKSVHKNGSDYFTKTYGDEKEG